MHDGMNSSTFSCSAPPPEGAGWPPPHAAMASDGGEGVGRRREAGAPTAGERRERRPPARGCRTPETLRGHHAREREATAHRGRVGDWGEARSEQRRSSCRRPSGVGAAGEATGQGWGRW
ncbi:unnamed protein product [Urochloa humidicola]